MQPTTIQLIGAGLFALALIHTFSTKYFEHLAHTRPAHAGLWHLLGEVEAVFGLWAMVLVLAIFVLQGQKEAVAYLESHTFTEPLFVFAIMVIAASRPILQLAMLLVRAVARLVPARGDAPYFLTTMALVPLLGSFITEPAAMTLAALILKERYYGRGISERLKYATLGVLFVNISIGGVLTPYAAPPILMVAAKWGWDLPFMLAQFGWKAALAVGVNALVLTFMFRRELGAMAPPAAQGAVPQVPAPIVLVHALFLAGVVFFAHHPVVFIGLLLFFIGFAHAYQRHNDRLILREGLMVGFFLAGLVVLGSQQTWWLQPLLGGMNTNALYFGATALTAITDNAALTYLGSLIEGTDAAFKYALVAGAVTGGGLTVIANAPNPAGYSLLKEHFDEGSINAGGLFLAALPPTLVAVVALWLL